ncbi:DUF3114 domain-containing protein [Streptococcus suis]|uniref:DUF3114 domain-containing protein n=1 Tax=Streptococcus suis TaxID=1307 RepID=UPI001EDD104A|nr:DUF3114 domain-containing protein [Streptococcus suis]
MMTVFLGLLVLWGIFMLIRYINRRKKALKTLEEVEPVRQALTELRSRGWSEKAIYKAFLKDLLKMPQNEILVFVQNFMDELSIFASTSFYKLLKAESWSMTKEKALSLLEQIMVMLEAPEELHHSHLPDLLEKMDGNCPPHHPFWRLFADLIDKAFPGQELAKNGELSKQVHQLRYLISYQQATWVRQHYGQGKSDWQALVAYLASLPRWSYRLRESARLHNKQFFARDEKKILPINLKVLIGFHSEFILAQEGQIALILEERPSKNGVVNGASFNYARANNQRHYQLDMAPVGPHDPPFRKKMIRSKAGTYLSPTRISKHKSKLNQTAWEQSYFNSQGYFSHKGHSRAALVASLGRRFAKDIRFEMYQKLISWYNKE